MEMFGCDVVIVVDGDDDDDDNGQRRQFDDVFRPSQREQVGPGAKKRSEVIIIILRNERESVF